MVLRLIETFVRLATRGGLADLLDDDGTALNLIRVRRSEFGNRQTDQIRLRRNASNQCQDRSDGYASRFPIRKIWKLDRIQCVEVEVNMHRAAESLFHIQRAQIHL